LEIKLVGLSPFFWVELVDKQQTLGFGTNVLISTNYLKADFVKKKYSPSQKEENFGFQIYSTVVKNGLRVQLESR